MLGNVLFLRYLGNYGKPEMAIVLQEAFYNRVSSSFKANTYSNFLNKSSAKVN